MGDNGKGSTQRGDSTSRKKYADGWTRIFGKGRGGRAKRRNPHTGPELDVDALAKYGIFRRKR